MGIKDYSWTVKIVLNHEVVKCVDVGHSYMSKWADGETTTTVGHF